jgi:hypothetical protein
MRLLLISLLLSSLASAQSWSAISGTAITAAICPANGASGTQCSVGGTGTFDGCSVNGASYPYQTMCSQVIRAYNGGAARTKAGAEQFIIWGGGHLAYEGNEVYSVDLFGTPTARRLTNPSQYLPSDNTLDCVDTLPDGQPNGRHTNSSMVYVPSLDRVYSLFGSLACGTGKSHGDIWYLDVSLSPPVWNKVTPNPAGIVPSYDTLVIAQGSGVVNSIWDEVTAKIYFTFNYSLYSLNPSDSMITKLSDNGTAIGAAHFSRIVLDSKRRHLWIVGDAYLGGARAIRISIAAGSTYEWEDMAGSMDSSCNTLTTSASGAGLFYDKNRDRFVGWFHNGGSTVWTMNPASLTCISYNAPGSAPPTGDELLSIYNRADYFPTLNKYVVVNDYNQAAYQLTMPINGLGASTIECVDKDGDGYGTGPVGAAPKCTGPDADDDDAAVHTGAEAITKWTTLKNFLAYRGYAPAKFWYLDDGGSDSATCNDTDGITNIGTPCATWAHIVSAGFASGDMVILRAGTYSFQFTPPSGTAGHPTIILAYPGEQPVLSASEAIDMTDEGWLVVDGVKFSGTAGTCPQAIGTYDGTTFSDNVMRRVEATGCTNGLRGGNGIVRFLLEESIFHDNTNHGVYLGARHNSGADNTVRRVISYNNGLTGMQWNGRVTGLLWEQNLTYNNDVTGYSWEMGVTNSTFRNNIALNNSGGLVLFNYPAQYVGDTTCGPSGTDTCTCSPQNLGTICPYSQTGNVIENSTFYVAQLDRTGASNVTAAAINVGKSHDCSGEALCDATTLGGNTYRNLLVMTYGSSVYMPMRFDQYGSGSLPTSTFQNITYWQNSGSTDAWGYRYVENGNSWLEYDCSTIGAIMTTGSVSGCSNADPLFTAHDPTWYNALASYNLRPAASSPAIGASSAGVTLDWAGSARSLTAPTIGAYEVQAGAPGGSGGSTLGGKVTTGGKVIR